MQIFLHSLLTASIIFAIQPSHAQQSVSAADLKSRIAASFLQVWPSEDISIEIVGCNFRMEQRPAGSTELHRVTSIWLGDLETTPDRVYRDEGQLMGDGSDKTWRDFSVLYKWRTDVLQKHADEVTRWAEKNEHLFSDEGTTDQELKEFLSQMSDGTFGSFFQRNLGWVESRTTLGEISIEPLEVIWSDPNIGTGLSFLSFTYRDTVVDGLIRDLDRYTKENCSAE